MLSWVHWFNRPKRYLRAFATLKIITSLKFAQLWKLEERDFLKELRISPS
jgi:hypothetical protein